MEKSTKEILKEALIKGSIVCILIGVPVVLLFLLYTVTLKLSLYVNFYSSLLGNAIYYGYFLLMLGSYPFVMAKFSKSFDDEENYNHYQALKMPYTLICISVYIALVWFLR